MFNLYKVYKLRKKTHLHNLKIVSNKNSRELTTPHPHPLPPLDVKKISIARKRFKKKKVRREEEEMRDRLRAAMMMMMMIKYLENSSFFFFIN